MEQDSAFKRNRWGKKRGPIPLWKWLIDKLYSQPLHNLDCFNMHQQMPNEAGWWNMKKTVKEIASNFAQVLKE
jgi:hypothetical protein